MNGQLRHDTDIQFWRTSYAECNKPSWNISETYDTLVRRVHAVKPDVDDFLQRLSDSHYKKSAETTYRLIENATKLKADVIGAQKTLQSLKVEDGTLSLVYWVEGKKGLGGQLQVGYCQL